MVRLMARCSLCKRDMSMRPRSCEAQPGAITYGSERRWQRHEVEPPECCRDCGVRIGRYHHQFCAIEECPTCGCQALGGCACTTGTVH